jgi:hypothetical protein
MINKTKFVILEFFDYEDNGIGEVSTLDDGKIFFDKKEAEYEVNNIITEELVELQEIAVSAKDNDKFTRDENTIYVNGDLFKRYYIVELK